MDYAAKVKPQRRQEPQKTAPRRLTRLGIDVPFLLSVIALLIFGAVMVYSSSWDFSRNLHPHYDSGHIFKRQLLWIGLGSFLAVVLTFIPYHWWKKLAILAMGGTIIILTAVLFLGDTRYSATRSFSQGSYQPAELAKLILIIYLAVWLYSKRDNLHSVWLGLVPLGLIIGGVAALIFLEPDYSAVLTILALGGLMFFLANGDLRQIAVLLVLAVISGLLIVTFTSTGTSRFTDWLGGLENPLNASDHVRRALEAFINGGWFGLGIGKSETKLTSLPFPHTDSIFAVVGEETGVIGSVGLVALYGLFLWRSLSIARRAPDQLGALLAGGLGFWIALEAAINILVLIGLAPFAGNALPFISAGGSNLIVVMMAVGIIMNVSITASRHEQESFQKVSPVVDSRKAKVPARAGLRKGG